MQDNNQQFNDFSQNQNYNNAPPQQYPQYQPMMPQQKPKKPLHKKWWFWVIIVIVVLTIGSSLGENSDTTDTASTSAAQEKETTKFSKKAYKEKCKSIDYKELARNPDKHEGKNVKFTGEVVQVIESSWDNSVEYRISVTKESWGYSSDDIVYVTYTPSENESRILENDIVTFYGESKGLESYTSTLGGEITIPRVDAKVIVLKE